MQKLITEDIPSEIGERGNIAISFSRDDEENRISQSLQKIGFGVYKCKTLEALMELEHDDVKCIIVDVTADHRSTFHAIELIKQMPEGALIPLLVVADRDSKSDVVRALNSGANDYIIHPYTEKDFRDRVNKLVAIAEKNQ